MRRSKLSDIESLETVEILINKSNFDNGNSLLFLHPEDYGAQYDKNDVESFYPAERFRTHRNKISAIRYFSQ